MLSWSVILASGGGDCTPSCAQDQAAISALLMRCRHSNISGAGEAGMDGGHDRQVFGTGAGEQNNIFRPY